VAADLAAIESKRGPVFSAVNLRTEWAKACTALGLGRMEGQESKNGNAWSKYTGLIIHDLRRSAIRNMVNAGTPELIAMKISGHKTRAVFDRYHIISADDVSAAMRKIEAASVSVNSVKNAPRTNRKLLRARSSSG